MITRLTIVALAITSTFYYGLYWGQHKSAFVLGILCFLGPVVLMRGLRQRAGGLAIADLLLCGVLFCYVVMIPFAATALGALNAALLWLALLVTYRFFADGSPHTREWLHVGLITAATAIALMGLVSYTGVYVFPGQILGDRLAGAFHYPNTTATMLNMGLFAALLGANACQRRWHAVLMNSCVAICTTALILTMSRGGWIALSLTAVVAFWVKRGEFLHFVAQTTITLGAGFGGALAVMVARDHNGLLAALGMALAAGVMTGAVTLMGGRVVPIMATALLLAVGVMSFYAVVAADRYELANEGTEPRWRQIEFRLAEMAAGDYRLRGELTAELAPPAPAAGVVSVWDVTTDAHRRLAVQNITTSLALDLPFIVPEGAQIVEVRLGNVHPGTRVTLTNPHVQGLTAIPLSNIFHKVLPYDLAARVSEGLKLRALVEDTRSVFVRDGLAAFRRAPFLGYGGGAWGAVYSSVQSFFYGSGRAHADFIDFLLDIGVVGYALLLASFAWLLGSIILGKPPGTGVALGVSGVSLVVHSFGEAVVAFPVLYFWLLAILGVLRAEQTSRSLGSIALPIRRVGVAAQALVLIIGLVLSTMVVAADITSARAEQYDQARERTAATALHRQAMRLNPWHATRKADLALRLIHEPDTQTERRRLIESALRLAPFDPRITSLAGHHFFNQGEFSVALNHYLRTIELQPMNPATYEHAAFVAAEAALIIMPSARGRGERFAEQAVGIYTGFVSVQGRADPELLRRGVTPFAASPEFRLEVGRALVMLGRAAEAEGHLRAAQVSRNQSVKDRANLWLSQAYSMSGKHPQARAARAQVSDLAALEAYIARIERVLVR